jgi:hypothetical protein
MMADDWLFELPKVTRTYYRCLKDQKVTQKQLKKIVKNNPRRAASLKNKIHSCVLDAHPFVRGPRYFAPVIVVKKPK